MLQPFLEAQRSYERALLNLWHESQSRAEDGYRRFLIRQQEIQAEGQKGFDESYRVLLRALQQGADSLEEAQRQATEAQREYQDSLRKIQAAAQESWAEAQREYQESAGQAQEDGRRQREAAYRDYVRALGKAWGQVDAESFGPDALAALATSLSAVLGAASGPPGCF